jgi:hypothetical protein
MTMRKKDYCVRKAFEDLHRVSAVYESQNMQQLKQREEEYEKMLRLLQLMARFQK